MRYQQRNVASYDAPTNTLLYGNDSFLVDLMLQYKTKGIAGVSPKELGATYQLNVSNLLDNDDIVISSLRLRPSEATTVSGGSIVTAPAADKPYIRRGWRQTPRTVSFTLRLDF